MLRCKGVFYDCKDGAEARRFNRLLIDAGMIKGLVIIPPASTAASDCRPEACVAVPAWLRCAE